MSTELSSPQTIALSTLALLETRLRRIEFLLTGSSDHDGKPTPINSVVDQSSLPSNQTITGRLQQLQDGLNRLRKLDGPAGDLIRDIESLHTQVPEIFSDPGTKPYTSLSDQTTHIFANTPLYTETASRLSSLQTLQVPPASQTLQLVDIQPRIEAAKSKQETLEAQARELRERSIACLEWWVKFGIVGMGEVWANWEERLRESEKQLNRVERARADKEGYV